MSISFEKIAMWLAHGLVRWANKRHYEKAGDGEKIEGQVVIIGGESIEVSAMDLEGTCQLLVLSAPYTILLAEYLPDIRDSMDAPDSPRLLQTIFMRMRHEIQAFPGDLTKALAIMLRKEPEWVAQQASPAEVVAALPVLDRVNGFTELYKLSNQFRFGDTGKGLNNGPKPN